MNKKIKNQMIELELSIIDEGNKIQRMEKLIHGQKSKISELKLYRDELLQKFTDAENENVLLKQYLDHQADLNKKLLHECKIQDKCINNIKGFFEKLQSEYVQMNVTKNQVLAYIKKMGL